MNTMSRSPSPRTWLRRSALGRLVFTAVLIGGVGAASVRASDTVHPLCSAASAERARLPPATACVTMATGAGGGASRVLVAATAGATGLPVGELAAADFVLLGEIHDNPHHHRLRGALLREIAAARAPPNGGARPGAVVFEHLRADQGPALDGLRRADGRFDPGLQASALLAAVDWASSGWPAADLFEPLFGAAIEGGFVLATGDPARGSVREVARKGLAVLASVELDALGLATPLDAPSQAELLDELVQSHCGVMPASAFGGMADAQRYRDAHLARAMVTARERHGSVVLIAGNGHVRADRGVPWHLGRMAPGRSIVSILFVEASGEKPLATDYVRGSATGRALADYVVVTPAIVRPDPCEVMRQRAGSKK